MAESFLEIMESWRGQLLHELATYWWGPAVGVLIFVVYGTLEHRFYSAINTYIDLNWYPAMASTFSTPASRIMAAAILFIAPLLFIVVHAYIVTRRSDEIWAELIQSKMFPANWVTPIAMDLLDKMGRPNEEFEFDALYEIYVVNRGKEITSILFFR